MCSDKSSEDCCHFLAVRGERVPMFLGSHLELSCKFKFSVSLEALEMIYQCVFVISKMLILFSHGRFLA